MFFHKHKYDVDAATAAVIEILNELEKTVKELKDDVTYIIDMLDESA
jgi:hypothetical protein